MAAGFCLDTFRAVGIFYRLHSHPWGLVQNAIAHNYAFHSHHVRSSEIIPGIMSRIMLRIMSGIMSRIMLIEETEKRDQEAEAYVVFI